MFGHYQFEHLMEYGLKSVVIILSLSTQVQRQYLKLRLVTAYQDPNTGGGVSIKTYKRVPKS